MWSALGFRLQPTWRVRLAGTVRLRRLARRRNTCVAIRYLFITGCLLIAAPGFARPLLAQTWFHSLRVPGTNQEMQISTGGPSGLAKSTADQQRGSTP